MNEKKNEYYSSDGLVICQICKKKFNFITGRHLFTHNISLKLYKEEYPNAPLKAKCLHENNKTQIKTDPKIEELVISDTFSEEETISETFKDSESIIALANKKVSIPKTKSDPMDDKLEIIAYLKLSYPNVKNNYMFKKKNPSGMIEFQFITDMADPSSKTVFDFPKSFWHNEQIGVSSQSRNQILKTYGWKIITIDKSMPRVFDVEKVISVIKTRK